MIKYKFNLVVGLVLLSVWDYVMYEMDFFNQIIWLIFVIANLWFGIPKQIKEKTK